MLLKKKNVRKPQKQLKGGKKIKKYNPTKNKKVQKKKILKYRKLKYHQQKLIQALKKLKRQATDQLQRNLKLTINNNEMVWIIPSTIL